MKKVLIYLACIFMFNACSNKQPIDKKAESEKLMQASRDWSKAAGERNIEKVLSYWQDDAMMFGPNQPTLNNKKAIAEMINGAFSNPSFTIQWEPISATVSDDGSMGYIIEKTSMSYQDSSRLVSEKLNAVSIWKKQTDGSWKNVVDITTPE